MLNQFVIINQNLLICLLLIYMVFVRTLLLLKLSFCKTLLIFLLYVKLTWILVALAWIFMSMVIFHSNAWTPIATYMISLSMFVTAFLLLVNQDLSHLIILSCISALLSCIQHHIFSSFIVLPLLKTALLLMLFPKILIRLYPVVLLIISLSLVISMLIILPGSIPMLRMRLEPIFWTCLCHNLCLR